MGDIAIRVEGLSKQFRIGSPERYRTLRDTLTDTISKPFRRLMKRGSAKVEPETIWALKDVSFEVKHGEVMGVIGRNGAGKSTLLKILSRITEPTEGRVQISGRVGSLLEVGTGFHPELSGRENIFLNGAILGMKRAEILRKFDEIVAFSEVDKFIDTPVKHYSSGMYVRLAFGVAAHMETENLIVDEVLAVGDQKFQDKCLNKMSEVGKQGRTVLFVSHSMPSIQRLCRRALILENGSVKLDTDPRLAVAEYLSGGTTDHYFAEPSTSQPTITRAAICVVDNHIQLSVEMVSPFSLTPNVGFIMYDGSGSPIFGTNIRSNPDTAVTPCRTGSFTINIPALYFRPNRYFFSLYLGDSYTDYCILERAVNVELGHTVPDELPPSLVGCLNIPVEWQSESTDVPAGTVFS
jgi:lipopolysaccharide transport system ATP-binding protein